MKAATFTWYCRYVQIIFFIFFIKVVNLLDLLLHQALVHLNMISVENTVGDIAMAFCHVESTYGKTHMGKPG